MQFDHSKFIYEVYVTIEATRAPAQRVCRTQDMTVAIAACKRQYQLHPRGAHVALRQGVVQVPRPRGGSGLVLQGQRV